MKRLQDYIVEAKGRPSDEKSIPIVRHIGGDDLKTPGLLNYALGKTSFKSLRTHERAGKVDRFDKMVASHWRNKVKFIPAEYSDKGVPKKWHATIHGKPEGALSKSQIVNKMIKVGYEPHEVNYHMGKNNIPGYPKVRQRVSLKKGIRPTRITMKSDPKVAGKRLAVRDSSGDQKKVWAAHRIRKVEEAWNWKSSMWNANAKPENDPAFAGRVGGWPTFKKSGTTSAPKQAPKAAATPSPAAPAAPAAPSAPAGPAKAAFNKFAKAKKSDSFKFKPKPAGPSPAAAPTPPSSPSPTPPPTAGASPLHKAATNVLRKKTPGAGLSSIPRAKINAIHNRTLGTNPAATSTSPGGGTGTAAPFKATLKKLGNGLVQSNAKGPNGAPIKKPVMSMPTGMGDKHGISKLVNHLTSEGGWGHDPNGALNHVHDLLKPSKWQTTKKWGKRALVGAALVGAPIALGLRAMRHGGNGISSPG